MKDQNQLLIENSYQIIEKTNNNNIKNTIFFRDNLELSKIHLILPNLDSYEIQDDCIILNSPVIIGNPIKDEKDNLSSSTKIEIINKYLELAKDFASLPLFIQISLMKSENFYISQNKLIHRGILVLDEKLMNFDLKYNHLIKLISSEILDIIDNDLSLINFKKYFRELFDSNDDTSIEEIIDNVKKIYISTLFEKDKFLKEESPNQDKKIKLNWSKQFINKIIKFIPILEISILLSIITYITLIIYSFTLSFGTLTTDRPIAKFDLTQQKNSYIAIDRSYSENKKYEIVDHHWTLYRGSEKVSESNNKNFNFYVEDKGRYRVELVVRDKQDQESEVYSQNVYYRDFNKSDEKLDYLELSNVNKNKEESFRGQYSLEFTQKNNKFSINNINIENNLYLGFYAMIKGEVSSEPVGVLIRYYLNNKEYSHEKYIYLNNYWQFIDLNFENLKNTSSITIEFSNIAKNNKLFIDEIDVISTFNSSN